MTCVIVFKIATVKNIFFYFYAACTWVQLYEIKSRNIETIMHGRINFE